MLSQNKTVLKPVLFSLLSHSLIILQNISLVKYKPKQFSYPLKKLFQNGLSLMLS